MIESTFLNGTGTYSNGQMRDVSKETFVPLLGDKKNK